MPASVRTAGSGHKSATGFLSWGPDKFVFKSRLRRNSVPIAQHDCHCQDDVRPSARAHNCLHSLCWTCWCHGRQNSPIHLS
eukprot:3899842-Rhodomonas_salina.1